jgi:rhodanese-related sulfurtransferase
MVRRLKADVLTELPPKRRQVIELPNGCDAVKRELAIVSDNEAQLDELRVAVELAKASDDPEIYKTAVRMLQDASQVAFTEMSQARHETALAKVPYMIQHLTDALQDGQKIVFFCHHRDVAQSVATGLRDAGFGTVMGTGDMPVTARQASVEAFQTDANTRAIVCTIAAMGTGHTLTASSHVVFGELDWVPGNVTQAEDRCHRIGQRGSVLVQHLVLEGSLDATMARTLVEKQEVIDKALDREPEPIIVPSRKPQAASQDANRDKIGEIAAKLVDEDVTAIQAALMMLANLNHDFAKDRNDMGFNKIDTTIGMSLAEGWKGTKRQAALGLKICQKYNRTQLGGTLTEIWERVK